MVGFYLESRMPYCGQEKIFLFFGEMIVLLFSCVNSADKGDRKIFFLNPSKPQNGFLGLIFL